MTARYSMSPDEAGLAVAALTRIAADHERTASGHRKRLQRHEAITIAREACERLGIFYGSKKETVT